tara:strand:+ start:703 stop:1623 length:921 start_codon:yes stop_codon:yes gene_type:complete
MATGTFPTASNSSTTLAELIPLIWGERVNDFFRCATVLAPFFTDRSAELAGGGSALYTPNLTEMAAYAKVNAQAVTLNNTTETKVTLTVNQWFEVSFAIEDREAATVKQSYALQERYAKNAGYTIAQKLEVALATLFSGFSSVVGASTTNLADSEIRQAIATLESSCVEGIYNGEVAFVMHPNVFWKQVQNIDKFSLAINSPVNDPTSKKPAGYLYGLPVIISPNVQYVSSTTGRNNALVHKDAIHWATSALGTGGSMAGTVVGSSGIRVQSHYVPEYLSTVTTADILYGVVENRDNAGVLIRTAN